MHVSPSDFTEFPPKNQPEQEEAMMPVPVLLPLIPHIFPKATHTFFRQIARKRALPRPAARRGGAEPRRHGDSHRRSGQRAQREPQRGAVAGRGSRGEEDGAGWNGIGWPFWCGKVTFHG